MVGQVATEADVLHVTVSATDVYVLYKITH